MSAWRRSVIAGVALAATIGCAQRDWTRPVGYEGSIVNADAVRRAIEQDAAIDSSRVNVVTEGGVVYINGVVTSDESRRDVEHIAEDVHGVSRVVNRLRVSDEATGIPTSLIHGGSCSIVSRASGQYRYGGRDPVYPLWTPRPMGEPVRIQVWEDTGGARNVVRRTGHRDELTREEMLSGRERSEVREEIREGDRTVLREEQHVREEPAIRQQEMQEHRMARERDQDPSMLWSGKLKHRDTINISGPRMIRYTYDIGELHGERTAACNGGPIFVP